MDEILPGLNTTVKSNYNDSHYNSVNKTNSFSCVPIIYLFDVQFSKEKRILNIAGEEEYHLSQLVLKFNSRSILKLLMQRILKSLQTSGIFLFAPCFDGFDTSVVTIQRLSRSLSA